jgi:hypothetical protein
MVSFNVNQSFGILSAKNENHWRARFSINLFPWDCKSNGVILCTLIFFSAIKFPLGIGKARCICCRLVVLWRVVGGLVLSWVLL